MIGKKTNQYLNFKHNKNKIIKFIDKEVVKGKILSHGVDCVI